MQKFDYQLIELYRERFINRDDEWFKAYVRWDRTFSITRQKPEWENYEPVTNDLIVRHFFGTVTCVWPAIDANGYGVWLAYDCDFGDGRLDKLQSFLERHGWHCLRTVGRADRDGHLYMCFDRPVKAEYLMTWGSYMLKRSGVAGIEIFPKSTNGFSQLRGPLGINLKPDANRARDWFIGANHDVIEQLLWLREQPLNNADRLETEAVKFQQRSEPKPMPKPRGKAAGRNKFKPLMFDFAVVKTGAKPGLNGWYNGRCPVPSHKNGDKHKSFGLLRAPDGTAIPKCFTGCPPRSIYDALRI